jgi:NET1-associated nuclear protein 1 (U3 small nucleolar RNA-associated protein 17)
MQCAAIDSTDSLLAAGDVSGRIQIWHNFPAALRGAAAARGASDSTAAAALPAPVATTWHWHAHPVRGLTFSADGVYLLSGGMEGVLVSRAGGFRRFKRGCGRPCQDMYRHRVCYLGVMEES